MDPNNQDGLSFDEIFTTPPIPSDIKKEDFDEEIHWMTKDGVIMFISDMTDNHLNNTINFIYKRGMMKHKLKYLLLERDARIKIREAKNKEK